MKILMKNTNKPPIYFNNVTMNTRTNTKIRKKLWNVTENPRQMSNKRKRKSKT